MKQNREIRANLLKRQRLCKEFEQPSHREWGWLWVRYLQTAEQGNYPLRHDTAVLGWAVWKPKPISVKPHGSLLVHISPSKHLLRNFHISVHKLSHPHALNYLNKYSHKYPGISKVPREIKQLFLDRLCGNLTPFCKISVLHK